MASYVVQVQRTVIDDGDRATDGWIDLGTVEGASRAKRASLLRQALNDESIGATEYLDGEHVFRLLDAPSAHSYVVSARQQTVLEIG